MSKPQNLTESLSQDQFVVGPSHPEHPWVRENYWYWFDVWSTREKECCEWFTRYMPNEAIGYYPVATRIRRDKKSGLQTETEHSAFGPYVFVCFNGEPRWHIVERNPYCIGYHKALKSCNDDNYYPVTFDDIEILSLKQREMDGEFIGKMPNVQEMLKMMVGKTYPRIPYGPFVGYQNATIAEVTAKLSTLCLVVLGKECTLIFPTRALFPDIFLNKSQ